jgi:hypothetical protein
MEAHRLVRRRGSHVLYTIVSLMAVRLSPYAPADLYTPGRFLVHISVRGCVNTRAIVRLEGLDQFKKIQ